mgnify:FL=1
MTDTETDTDAKQVSQKAQSLATFTKARGSGMLNLHGWNTLEAYRIELTDSPTRVEEVWELLNGYGNRPLFIRACPLNARPGVLESSPADSLDKMHEIVNRITATMLGPDPDPSNPMYEHGLCDPDGCIIVQQFIEADASAVASPYSYVQVGAEHDGVTAGGKGFVITLDLSQEPQHVRRQLEIIDHDPQFMQVEFISSAAIKDIDTLVSGSRKDGDMDCNYMVQLRGASKGHPSIRSPPHPFELSGFIVGGKVTVKEVHTLDNNSDEELARLEEVLRGRDDLEGVVIVHPTGNQGSHHCGQCVAWGASYIINDSVEVGSTWVEVDGWVIDDPTIEPQPFNRYHWHEHFERGLTVGLTAFKRQYGWLSNHFHQFLGGAVMNSPSDTAYLAGVFSAYLPNAIFAVSMGEMRHHNSNKNNMMPVDMASFMALNHGVGNNGITSGNRQHYYSLIEERPITIPSLIGQMEWLVHQYNTGWGSGYGGHNYRDSTQKGVDILNALTLYNKENTEANFMALLGSVNEAENIVHNNGFFLDKFLNKRAFDVGTNAGGQYLTSATPSDFFNIYYAASHAHEVGQAYTVPTLTDTTDISTFALKQKNWQEQMQTPLFTRDDLPDTYLELADKMVAHGLHGQSIYSHNKEKFIPCGLTDCPNCVAMEVSLINNSLTLPLPNATASYDMTQPTNVVPLNILAPEGMDIDLLITVFKNNTYDELILPNVVDFYNQVHTLGLQNSNNITVQKAVKHYANWIGNLPKPFAVKLSKALEQATEQDKVDKAWAGFEEAIKDYTTNEQGEE